MKKLFCLLLAALLLCGLFFMTACGKERPAGETGDPAGSDAAGIEGPEDTGDADGIITVGAEAADYASLEEALDAVRERRQNGYDGNIRIQFRAGEYFFENTVEIGTDLSDITLEAFGDGEVSLIGGYRVTGFETDTFNGVPCLSAPVRNEDFTDFYVNGERAGLTRYPAEGYLSSEETDNPSGQWKYGSKWVVLKDETVAGFRNIDKVVFSVRHMWVDEHTPLDSYDPETGMMTLRYCTHFAVESGADYWLENVAETFGNPNEWYAENGRVYYIPRDDSITPETIRAYIPVVKKLIDVSGTTDGHVRAVTLKNLTLCVTRGEFTSSDGRRSEYDVYASDGQSLASAEGFVTFRYADDCTVENCLLTNYGLYGLEISFGSHRIAVRHCTFFDGGAGGIKIEGDEYDHGAESTTGNVVSDCTIRHCGRRYNSGCGILMMYTGENTIEHNEISDLFYSGISVGWGWVFYEDSTTYDNLITKNHIFDIGQGVLSDLGAIYTLGTMPGTVISYNLIHDITYFDYGARAFGLDAGTAELTIENNIAYNLGTGSVGCAIGENNVIRNNILFAGGGQVFDDYTQRKEHTLNFERNIIITDGKPVHLIDRGTLSQKLVSSSNNLIYDISGQDVIAAQFADTDKTWTLEQMSQFFGLEAGSIEADPQFADLENHDFTLAETSPAYEIGFVPFDLSDVGPRP